MSLLDSNGVIGCEHLPSRILHAKKNLHDFKFDTYDLELMERRMIMTALDEFGTNQKSKERVAKELGIGIATLYRKIKKYNISV
jgi:transcriptional regulator with PAS, ATPase and Fis domain